MIHQSNELWYLFLDARLLQWLLLQYCLQLCLLYCFWRLMLLLTLNLLIVSNRYCRLMSNLMFQASFLQSAVLKVNHRNLIQTSVKNETQTRKNSIPFLIVLCLPWVVVSVEFERPFELSISSVELISCEDVVGMTVMEFLF